MFFQSPECSNRLLHLPQELGPDVTCPLSADVTHDIWKRFQREMEEPVENTSSMRWLSRLVKYIYDWKILNNKKCSNIKSPVDPEADYLIFFAGINWKTLPSTLAFPGKILTASRFERLYMLLLTLELSNNSNPGMSLGRESSGLGLQYWGTQARETTDLCLYAQEGVRMLLLTPSNVIVNWKHILVKENIVHSKRPLPAIVLMVTRQFIAGGARCHFFPTLCLFACR